LKIKYILLIFILIGSLSISKGQNKFIGYWKYERIGNIDTIWEYEGHYINGSRGQIIAIDTSHLIQSIEIRLDGNFIEYYAYLPIAGAWELIYDDVIKLRYKYDGKIYEDLMYLKDNYITADLNDEKEIKFYKK